MWRAGLAGGWAAPLTHVCGATRPGTDYFDRLAPYCEAAMLFMVPSVVTLPAKVGVMRAFMAQWCPTQQHGSALCSEVSSARLGGRDARTRGGGPMRARPRPVAGWRDGRTPCVLVAMAL